MKQEKAFLGIDVGSISTKGVIIDAENHLLASEYIWTEGNPISAVRKLLGLLEEKFDREQYQIVGTGAFLSSQARRLGIEVEDMGNYALRSSHPTAIAARCTVFAESDLIHKIQMGHPREDIIAGVCRAVASNYLNNVGKGKKISSPVVFQGGVSKNIGVVHAFEDLLHCPILVDENGHLMGAIGAAILSRKSVKREIFDFSVENMEFVTREVGCGQCSNNCEIICVYRDGVLIDSWGNRCERGSVVAQKTLSENRQR